MTFCKICDRITLKENSLCQYHQTALENVHSAYESWKSASGINWEEYIEKLYELEETGQWILDVIEQIRSGDDLSIRT
ncbi:MAG: hypothetical protein ACFFFK_01045 [Candidatus Thorarchaeota archaeon]